MDKICLKGIPCLARIGVFEWERRLGCHCEIDLEISLDLSAAGKSDNLVDTIDYSAIQRAAIELAENCHFRLLERLAEGLAERVLAESPVREVRVVLKKTRIIGMPPLQYAAVDIVRRKST